MYLFCVLDFTAGLDGWKDGRIEHHTQNHLAVFVKQWKKGEDEIGPKSCCLLALPKMWFPLNVLQSLFSAKNVCVWIKQLFLQLKNS